MAFSWKTVTQINKNIDLAKKQIEESQTADHLTPQLNDLEQLIFKLRTELYNYIQTHGVLGIDGLTIAGEKADVKDNTLVVSADMLDDIITELGFTKDSGGGEGGEGTDPDAVHDVLYNGESVVSGQIAYLTDETLGIDEILTSISDIDSTIAGILSDIESLNTDNSGVKITLETLSNELETLSNEFNALSGSIVTGLDFAGIEASNTDGKLAINSDDVDSLIENLGYIKTVGEAGVQDVVADLNNYSYVENGVARIPAAISNVTFNGSNATCSIYGDGTLQAFMGNLVTDVTMNGEFLPADRIYNPDDPDAEGRYYIARLTDDNLGLTDIKSDISNIQTDQQTQDETISGIDTRLTAAEEALESLEASGDFGVTDVTVNGNSVLNGTIAELTDDNLGISGVKSDISALNGGIATLSSDFSELTETVNTIDSKADEALTTVKSCAESIETLNSEYDSVSQNLTGISGSLSDLSDTVANTIEPAIETLQNSVAEASESAIEAKTDASEAKEQVTKLIEGGIVKDVKWGFKEENDAVSLLDEDGSAYVPRGITQIILNDLYPDKVWDPYDMSTTADLGQVVNEVTVDGTSVVSFNERKGQAIAAITSENLGIDGIKSDIDAIMVGNGVRDDEITNLDIRLMAAEEAIESLESGGGGGGGTGSVQNTYVSETTSLTSDLSLFDGEGQSIGEATGQIAYYLQAQKSGNVFIGLLRMTIQSLEYTLNEGVEDDDYGMIRFAINEILPDSIAEVLGTPPVFEGTENFYSFYDKGYYMGKNEQSLYYENRLYYSHETENWRIRAYMFAPFTKNSQNIRLTAQVMFIPD